jgi:hypothetical protein
MAKTEKRLPCRAGLNRSDLHGICELEDHASLAVWSEISPLHQMAWGQRQSSGD